MISRDQTDHLLKKRVSLRLHSGITNPVYHVTITGSERPPTPATCNIAAEPAEMIKIDFIHLLYTSPPFRAVPSRHRVFA